MGQVSLRGIHKDYDGVQVIRGIDLDVHEGEFLVFVGPSGCGKSTILQIVAGLEQASAGTVEFGPPDAGANAQSPRTSLVFQEFALFPWRTVQDNVAYPLEMRGVGKRERYARDIRALGIKLD